MDLHLPFFKSIITVCKKYGREKEMHTIFFPDFYLNLYLTYNLPHDREIKRNNLKNRNNKNNSITFDNKVESFTVFSLN